MKTFIKLLIFFFVLQKTFAQFEKNDKIPVISDSILKDNYIKSVDLKRYYIDSLILNKNKINQETILLKINYSIQTEDGFYIAQNSSSLDSIPENYKKTDTISAIVTLYENKVLKIKLPIPIQSNIFPFLHNLYFDNANKLIFSGYRCADLLHMGLCNGTESEYSNYFKSGMYYHTVIKEHPLGPSCGCGINLIVKDVDDIIKTVLSN